jgi:hypothetical protein
LAFLGLTRFTHLLFFFTRPFLHVTGLAFGFTIGFTTATGAGFPAPENVALAGAPKTAGCGDAGGLHESPLSHGGGETDAGNPPSTLASYTSTRLSRSCATS